MTEMMVPVAAGVLLYGAYKVLENRTRLQEQDSERRVSERKGMPQPTKRPRDVFTHYVDPSTAVWDVNTDSYTFAVVDEGHTYDGNVRQDIRSGHGRAPVAGIY